jgi:hypothetical protein
MTDQPTITATPSTVVVPGPLTPPSLSPAPTTALRDVAEDPADRGDTQMTSATVPHAQPAAEAQVRDLRRETERLRSTISELRQELADAQEVHRQDVARIGEVLLREAKQRDWCQDYDDVVEELNQRLTVALPGRARAWDVSFDVRVTVRVERARGDGDARERAGDIAEDIERALHHLNTVRSSEVEDYDDFEVCEAA